MATLNSLRHVWSGLILSAVSATTTPAILYGAQVAFDLPGSIECREATPCDFAVAHPSLKVIEAKFRVSARMVEGKSADIVDFLYVFESTHKSMRLQDYLPNTTLESAVADDCIEITDATENSKASGAEAHVAYKILALGGSLNQTSKKSASSHYKQIASQDLVLASGTTHREHGVFFRLQPSRKASLEGAKEFTLLATVPKTWRGDLCTISCTARATKRSVISTSVVPGGVEQAQIGLYLAGDAEAAAIAEEFYRVQEARAALANLHSAKDCGLDTFSTQAVGFFTGKKSETQARKEREDADRAVLAIQNQLNQLAR
jgi:hypothetical protein